MFTCDLYVGYIPRGVTAVLKGMCIVKETASIVSKEVPSIFNTAHSFVDSVSPVYFFG